MFLRRYLATTLLFLCMDDSTRSFLVCRTIDSMQQHIKDPLGRLPIEMEAYALSSGTEEKKEFTQEEIIMCHSKRGRLSI
mmetsp:Transcript_61223/g.68551  ORF Transcript_61223/g.68551 Transcript_61223/m.68551 type:complete len:80 (-) Transcript_61223:154-393(-)